MLRGTKLFFLFLLLIYRASFSWGEGGTYALVFSGGAENGALGGSGVTNAKNISSVFLNPANLPVLYDELYTNIIYTSFKEDLWPYFNLDMQHTFQSFGLFLNDVFPYVDFGYSFFRNYMDLGLSEIYDSLGNVIDTSHWEEFVFSNSFGIRAFDIFSFGLSFKRFDSRLAPGIGGDEYPDDGTAQGNAFDIGLRVSKKFDIIDLFSVSPAIGAGFLNLGKDSIKYIDTSDLIYPLSREVYFGGSCDFNVLDIFEYTFLYDIEMCLFCKKWDDRIIHIGNRFQITPFFTVLRGREKDIEGNLNNKCEGFTFSLNLRKTYNMVTKVIKLIDYLQGKDNYTKTKEREKRFDKNGLKFRPNFYVSRTKTEIENVGKNFLVAYTNKKDWSLGIGVITSFPNYLKKEIPKEETVKEKKPEIIETEEDLLEEDSVIEEEEGELIE